MHHIFFQNKLNGVLYKIECKESVFLRIYIRQEKETQNSIIWGKQIIE